MLILAGFALGYVVNGAMAQRPAAAASTADQSSPSTSSIDSAIESAYATAEKSVVFIQNPGVGTGSGIIYDNQGDIVTNDHVISGGKSFQVTFANGKTVGATLVGSDRSDDLAVIHVSTTGLAPATFAPAGSYRVAETVLAIGSPLGLEQSVTSGLISGLNRTEQEPNGAYIPDAIQTSAPINPGNSGGALVSLNGDVVGIPTMVQTSDANNAAVQDIGFAIPSSRVTFIANQIISDGRVVHTGRAFLGVSVADAGSQQSFGFYNGQSTPRVSGAVVQRIEGNGPAGRAGLRVGDVITKLDGATISDSADLLAALAHDKPGQSVTMTFQRNGTEHTVQATLGELPAST